MSNDSKFFTNQKGDDLASRINELAKYSKSFDVLSGFFYSSGFYQIYKSLEDTDSIRILIGISTNEETFTLINQGNKLQEDKILNEPEILEKVEDQVESEMQNSDDSKLVEMGVHKFIEWIRSGKLVIKAYPSQNIHAKLYIWTFREGDREKGTVITGSSNLTQSGLINNLEFNVELKDRNDYEFAKDKFEELWKDSIDVSQKYVETVEEKTWLSDKITPYQLYLKFLYEHFKKDLNVDKVFLPRTPANFVKLEYQEQAVLNAKKILLAYGGVFISDVVGLGKTFIASMLAKQLDGRHLVIAPPNLLDENNPGSWKNAFFDFDVVAKYKSIGMLDDLVGGNADEFKNIFIDEAHRMRNADTSTYEKLAEICRGKRVILVSATPYNNSPKDILSLVQLFQKPYNSTLPGLRNLEVFFKEIEKRIKNVNRKKDPKSYLEVTKRNAKEVREKVLKHLMVRRTRSDIEKYFSKDLQKEGIKFPEVQQPRPLYYQLNEKENELFEKTIDMLANKLTYSRYIAMTYYIGDDFNESLKQGQKNLGTFMKILLVKRLESSFFAFKQSIKRFLDIYETFIETYEKGSVYISKDQSNKIFDLLDGDNDELIKEFLKNDKVQKYDSKDFKPSFLRDLKADRDLLEEIQELWAETNADPKLEELKKELETNPTLKDNHLIIFSESKETANYLFRELDQIYSGEVICFDGDSGSYEKQKVIDNFDASSNRKEQEFRILISTDVLSEGVNLHRSNVVFNYDIPWNPTRMMQRIGRVNRIDTEFNEIYTFNFFPSEKGNDAIALKSAAESKIAGFISLLGADAKLLTDQEDIASHSLFDKLNSIEEEEEGNSELKYLKLIKDIRKNDPNLFDSIKRLPKKARTAKKSLKRKDSLLTYFRKGDLEKFFTTKKNGDPEEISFFVDAASLLESSLETERISIPTGISELLEKNKKSFEDVTLEELPDLSLGKGKDKSAKLLKILEATRRQPQRCTEEQVDYLRNVIKQVSERGLPKKTVSAVLKSLESLSEEISDPLKVIGVLGTEIPSNLLKDHLAEKKVISNDKREVVLSMYLESSKDGNN